MDEREAPIYCVRCQNNLVISGLVNFPFWNGIRHSLVLLGQQDAFSWSQLLKCHLVHNNISSKMRRGLATVKVPTLNIWLQVLLNELFYTECISSNVMLSV